MSFTSFLSPILSYLPQHEGYLPKWLFLVGVISICNSIQSYSTLHFTERVYCGTSPLPNDRLPGSSPPPPPPSSSKPTPLQTKTIPKSDTKATISPSTSPSLSPATPLSSRTFGTWTLLTSIVRLYAAYHITNPQIYQLAIATYGVAWMHFMSEWLVFRSTSWGKGLVGPVAVANLSLGWMIWGWEFYVEN